jgi:NTE family protein
MRHRVARMALATMVGLVMIGCALQGSINARWGPERAATAYGFDPLLADRDADRLFVCLTFSGGGTRAAAFAFGVVDQLRQISSPGPGGTLLGDVDCISAVSGGAFVAAYYGLAGDDLFSQFPRRFLYENITLRLALKVLNPVAASRLMSPTYDRSDLAADVYDAVLFGEAKYRALIERSVVPSSF